MFAPLSAAHLGVRLVGAHPNKVEITPRSNICCIGIDFTEVQSGFALRSTSSPPQRSAFISWELNHT